MSSKSLQVNIQNLGEQPLYVNDFIFSDLTFSSETSTLNISAYSEKIATVHFNPLEVKEYKSTLTLRSNAGDLTINLNGECILDTGIETLENKTLTIAPNPSPGIYIVNFNDANSQDAEFKVYDLSGRCILNQSATSRQTEIDLSNFAAGIYYLNIETELDIFVEKLMKY